MQEKVFQFVKYSSYKEEEIRIKENNPTNFTKMPTARIRTLQLMQAWTG